ncbi:ketosamine-3-kinase-like isoform X1 [Anguilla anguilla]|uniref:ketosamine-3-kinase-like isoform X1 n=1 Tax=Anguilla anguilla TaxID=7936 RepID=UPI0015B092E1|nr:ketosamine-3-kinase-like isoform X1 [Anguilla anguilla]
MEVLLKKELRTSMLKASGHVGVGYISEGQSYDIDSGRVFVKINHKSQARLMFDGEAASLDDILKTETVKVPKPTKVIDLETGGAVFIMEHLDMKSLCKYSAQLGDQLADLHLHNQRQRDRRDKEEQTVGKGSGQSDVPVIEKYGFHTTTCCGYLPQVSSCPRVLSLAQTGFAQTVWFCALSHLRISCVAFTQVNDWQSNWVAFFTQQRLQHQLGLLEQSCGDREVQELWSQLQLKIPEMFEGAQVYPALLHGDLWSGNVAQCSGGPVVFDPCSFYGHSEFELAMPAMFGGFSDSFYAAYHERLPKAPGFEARHLLYRLFNYLNHWNHFGSSEYRGPSLRTMKTLLE